ncbi:MAG TPA: ECF transporter S component [Mobilitalea sp.]|nr:ECF transporter S component [Mobilitalea sp.]
MNTMTNTKKKSNEGALKFDKNTKVGSSSYVGNGNRAGNSTKVGNSLVTNRVFTIKSMAVMAMLSGVAILLMLFEIPLWFAPFFYKLDFSEVPVLIGAFTMGPVAGIIIEFVKILLNFATDGTYTMGIGELANFLIGCSLVVPASIIYAKKKTRKSAIQGLVVGTIFMAIMGGILNAFVLLPAFSFFTDKPVSAYIQMGTAVNPAISNMTTFVLLAVTPFNILKGVVVSIITILIYKSLSKVIKTFTK